MAKKFLLPYLGQIASRSLSRAAILTFLLFLISRGFGSSFWLNFFFILIAFAFYLMLPADRVFIRFSYALLLFLGLIGANFIKQPPFALLSLILFGALLFIFFGLAYFQFSDRYLVYGIWQTMLMFFLFLVIFFFSGALRFSPSAVLFFVLWPMFSEVLSFFDVARGKPKAAFAAVPAYLGAMISFPLLYLPLGFINAAVFLTLFMLLIRDILLFHFQGNLDFPFILKELTFFIVIGTLVFAASRWSL